MRIHIVQQGDTVFTIAQRFSVTSEAIIRDNQLAFPNRLVVGQALVIQEGCFSYTVKSGDTPYSIANDMDISLQALIQANPLIGVISPGQTLLIPPRTPRKQTAIANGYCYPHIQADILNATLPFLTTASIFSYEVRSNGSLNPIPDNAALTLIKEGLVAPLMVITNIDETGSFSTELASTILRNPRLQDTLIYNILAIMNQKGYSGLDVDFEYVSGSDRYNYNDFLRRCADALYPLGYTLSTAVAAKTRDDQPGTLFEGADYRAHGEIVDHVLIMTYDWGYQFGPPMAVSPFHKMEEVIQYAVTAIPSHKILLGIPNYGYDWALPYRQGEPARLIHNIEAVNLASTNWAQIQFDALSKTPFFEYRDTQGRQHIVWFDDARSFDYKLSLVQKYKLAGIGYWNINTLFLPGWLVFSSLYTIAEKGVADLARPPGG